MSDIAKRNAAREALKLVEDGMVLGLGTGSTAKHFVDGVGELIAKGWKLSGAPTSIQTEKQAVACGIPLVDLDDVDVIHLTIDGADEFDPDMNLIKGGGAALLREKIIADYSERMVVITDASKQVETLGAFPLPVEVNPFGMALTRKRISHALEMLGMKDISIKQRANGDGSALFTDGGHHIYDLHCGQILDVASLATMLDQIPGVVEHGLFVGLADAVIIGNETGTQTLIR
ncbi:MAG: ribose 5-phosphate isomerase A [Hirschia sp.]|mgnify:CR=1 FL=1|nr:ribose 5-phosphate isomerase A [Hirschia sp.]MBF18356.1 ribose 5-phosphate isomerase A [Hirschia sp.]